MGGTRSHFPTEDTTGTGSLADPDSTLRLTLPRVNPLEKNLAALTQQSPSAATAVQTVTIPAGFARMVGTDGLPTFARNVGEGPRRIEWLGNTSMPRASAAAIVSSLDPYSNGVNGLGLSIGTGSEWAAFAAKLGPAQMVYVYEPDPGLLRMALEVCDLSQLIAQRKVVILTGTPAVATAELAAFLDTHRGFEPPTVLHPLTSLSSERRNQLLTAGEIIVRSAVTERQALEQQLLLTLTATPTTSRDTKRIAFLLTSAYEAERPLHREVERTGTQAAPIATHDACSVAWRLQTLLNASKHGLPAVVSDLFRHQLGPIPHNVPVETWVPPFVGPGFWDRLPPAGLAAHDTIVVHAGRHAERLKSRGIPAAQIKFKPLPRTSIPAMPTTDTSARNRVVLVADLPATSMEALKIELPTQQSIFKAASDIIAADYLTVHPGMVASILNRSLTRAGVAHAAADRALQDFMSRIIQDFLIPALPPMVLAGMLAREGIALTLIGDWPGVAVHLRPQVASDSQRLRHIPFASLQNAHWNEIAVVAHLAPDGVPSPLLWNAVAMGCAIVSPRHASDSFEGSIASLLAPETMFAHPAPQHFVSTVTALLKDPARRQKLALAAAVISPP